MAYPIVTKDGITISGIPDNIAKDDQRLKDSVASLRAAGTKAATWEQLTGEKPPDVTNDPAQAVQADPQKPSLMQKLVPGGMEEVKRNAGAAFRGIAGGAASTAGLVVDPITAITNLLIPGKQDYMTLNQSIQSLLTKAGVPEAETEAEKIMQAAVGGISGGGSSSLLGKAVSVAPGAMGAVGKAMEVGAGSQMLGGAASEASSEIARQQGASPAVQAAIGLASGMGAGGLAALKENPLTPGIVGDAQDAGIRVLTSDAVQPKTGFSKWLQGAGEKIPITGTGGVRKAQQAERVAAVDDIVQQYGSTDLKGILGSVTRDLIDSKKEFFKKWGGEKSEVIERLSKVDASPVSLSRTNAKIDEQIDYLVSLKSKQNQPVIDVLTDWKQALQDQPLANVEDLRKQIGEAFTSPDMAASRSTGEKILSSIYEPLNEDMGDYIKTVGKDTDFTKWKVANTNLSNKIAELELPALKNVLESGEATPENVQRLLFSKNRSDIAALYRNLSEDGRAAARSAVIAKAAYKNGEQVNPDAFAKEIGKLGDQIGILFSGDDLKQIKGLTKVLNMTQRAGEFAAMPPTGIQLLPGAGLVGAGALGQKLMPGAEGYALGAGIVGAAGLVPRAYESKAVRNILINLSQVKENTPEAKALLATLTNVIQSQNQKMQGDTTPVKKERTNTDMPN
jgi:hypothetical protein